jgi:hypothetical protein
MLYLVELGILAGVVGGRRREGLGRDWDARVHHYQRTMSGSRLSGSDSLRAWFQARSRRSVPSRDRHADVPEAA